MATDRSANSAPNSSIDAAGPQAEHRRIAEQALLKSRRPSEIQTPDERRAVGTNNGALPTSK